MVLTKSVDNYEQYIKELTAEFEQRYGPHESKVFISMVRDRYDRFGRVFLDKNIMWKLTDDFFSVRNGNMISYLVVGLGLTGKSTFFKNVAYFLDPEFRANMLVWGFEEMVDKISEVIDNDNPFRSILTDEPNDYDHPQSKQGKKFKEIMGQLRQQSPFLLYCSTDFKDMPPTIIGKLNGLFYLNSIGHGYFIRNDPENNIYPLDDFKKKFKDKGYTVFADLFTKYNFLEFITHKNSILDFIDPGSEKKYIRDKKKKLKNSIKEYKSIKNRAYGTNLILSEEVRLERKKAVIEMKKQGLSRKEIALAAGISTRQVTNITNEMTE